MLPRTFRTFVYPSSPDGIKPQAQANPLPERGEVLARLDLPAFPACFSYLFCMLSRDVCISLRLLFFSSLLFSSPGFAEAGGSCCTVQGPSSSTVSSQFGGLPFQTNLPSGCTVERTVTSSRPPTLRQLISVHSRGPFLGSPGHDSPINRL